MRCSKGIGYYSTDIEILTMKKSMSCKVYLYQNIWAVKMGGPFKIKAGWKSCEIKGGGQEVAVMVG